MRVIKIWALGASERPTCCGSPHGAWEVLRALCSQSVQSSQFICVFFRNIKFSLLGVILVHSDGWPSHIWAMCSTSTLFLHMLAPRENVTAPRTKADMISFRDGSNGNCFKQLVSAIPRGRPCLWVLKILQMPYNCFLKYEFTKWFSES